MKKLIFCIFILFVLLISKGYSQSAVYFCTETGAYGYAFSYSTENIAKTKAYDACIEYGGTNPVLIASTSNQGYGAIAIGKNSDGNRVIGVALGYSSLSSAKQEAIRQCEDYGGYGAEIKNTWNDN
jgi:hypothetical protein